MSEEKQVEIHSFIMENRKKLTLTGVRDVESFDENNVTMDTVQGSLTIKGEGLHISGFNRETGDLSMDGFVSSAQYSDSKKQSGSVLSRIFK